MSVQLESTPVNVNFLCGCRRIRIRSRENRVVDLVNTVAKFVKSEWDVEHLVLIHAPEFIPKM